MLKLFIYPFWSRRFTGFVLFSLILSSCATQRGQYLKKQFDSPSTEHQFSGFLLYDPATKDTIYAHNQERYFTPASTTKIATLYAALQVLSDSIPALRYTKQGDTLYVEGTGDPTFLHPYFNDSTAFHLAKNYSQIQLSLTNFREERLGPGWAWEDYEWYYAPERSAIPMYGNLISMHRQNGLHITPPYFKDHIRHRDSARNRALHTNTFYFGAERKDTLEVPFINSSFLTKTLLEELLEKPVGLVDNLPSGTKVTLYSVPSDSLYKRMMVESDNFLAEQLMIVASSSLSDTLNFSKVRNYILENHLEHLKHSPRWVDGSGLSRYNLFTPTSMVQMLDELYKEVPKNRLLNFFPVGGVSGTLKNWYAGNPNPYIYAKSGTLGNNYSLSGYLLAKSGKVLIFSFMNNHFIKPTNEVREEMQAIFEHIRDTY